VGTAQPLLTFIAFTHMLLSEGLEVVVWAVATTVFGALSLLLYRPLRDFLWERLRRRALVVAVWMHVPAGSQVRTTLRRLALEMAFRMHVPGPCCGDAARRLLVEPAPREPCVICLDAIETGQCVHQLRCGHSFHRWCVDDWMFSSWCDGRSAPSCPICRQTMLGNVAIGAIATFRSMNTARCPVRRRPSNLPDSPPNALDMQPNTPDTP